MGKKESESPPLVPPLFSSPPYKPCRDACVDAEGLSGLGENSTSRDHAPVRDIDAVQNAGSGSNPNIIANTNAASGNRLTSYGNVAVIDTVIHRNDDHVGGNAHIIANCQAAMAVKNGERIDRYSVAEANGTTVRRDQSMTMKAAVSTDVYRTAIHPHHFGTSDLAARADNRSPTEPPV